MRGKQDEILKTFGETFVCPNCGGKTTVTDSRAGRTSIALSGSVVRRRRKCLNSECGFRMSTYEIGETSARHLMRVSKLLEKINEFAKEANSAPASNKSDDGQGPATGGG